MLLVMDVGNTNIKMGIYQEDKLIDSWRLSSKPSHTSDEYGVLISNWFFHKGYNIKEVVGVIISSVIPSLNFTLEHMCKYYIGVKPLIVGPGVKTGLNIKYDDPKEVGADRIVNSVAAYNIYGGPCIVIDFGTATTFNVVSSKGEFLGGAIAAGLKMSRDGLVNNAANLPNVEIKKPKGIINKSTITNMQGGLIYGFVGLVEYIVNKIKAEIGPNAVVVATGGFSQLVGSETTAIDHIDKTLTLEGLRMIYSLN